MDNNINNTNTSVNSSSNPSTNNVVPVIVNGNLNMGNNRNKKEVSHQEKLPKKRFTMMDVLLTIIGICLIGYGVYNLLNKDNTKSNEEPIPTKEEEKEPQMSVTDAVSYITLTKEESNIYSKEDLQAMTLGMDVQNLSNNAKLALASRIVRLNVNQTGTHIDEKDLDDGVKKLFGNIDYTKSAFNYANDIYTYNQETKKYYLLDSSSNNNYNYEKYAYTETDEKEDSLIVREYIAYTDINNTRSWTLNNVNLTNIINNSNIKNFYKTLKYMEYEFNKTNGNYYLKRISIK